MDMLGRNRKLFLTGSLSKKFDSRTFLERSPLHADYITGSLTPMMPSAGPVRKKADHDVDDGKESGIK
jgi:hypothetical protein